MDGPKRKPLFTPIPLITFLVSLGVVIFFGLTYPVFMPEPPLFDLTGGLLMLAGVYILFLFARLFRKHNTTVRPGEVPSSLITEDIYQLSRNPAYFAELLILIGLSIVMQTPSSLLGALMFYLVLNTLVIPFEEKQLLSVFGDEYKQYMDKIRRWI